MCNISKANRLLECFLDDLMLTFSKYLTICKSLHVTISYCNISFAFSLSNRWNIARRSRLHCFCVNRKLYRSCVILWDCRIKENLCCLKIPSSYSLKIILFFPVKINMKLSRYFFQKYIEKSTLRANYLISLGSCCNLNGFYGHRVDYNN